MDLIHQALELIRLQAHGMLTVAGIFACDVPIRHPTELLLLSSALQHDKERIKRNLFLFLAEPRFQLVRQECRHDFENPVAGSKLKIEGYMQFASAAAARTLF